MAGYVSLRPRVSSNVMQPRMRALVTDLTTFGRNGELVRALAAHDVRFLIVGGMAVAFYGCREPDEVNDLDLLLDPDQTNVDRFRLALAAEGGDVNWDMRRLCKPKVQMPLKSDFYVDILTPDKETPFSTLLAASMPATLNGVAVRIIGKNHLIQLKSEAAESTRIVAEKHARDLRCLRAA